MKREIKIICYGTIVLGIILLITASLIIPVELFDATYNANWLWLYTPHVIGAIYLFGSLVYEGR